MKSIVDASERSDVGDDLERAMAFVRRALRFWWIVASALLVGAVAFAAFLWLRTPHYRSETVILYSEPIRATEAAVDSGHNPRGQAIRLEELLVSRSQLERLIQEFNLYPDVVAKYGMVDAVAEFRKDIDFRAPGGDTFAIGFEGTSPEQAQQVTARLAETLLGEDARLRNEQAKATRDFLHSERNRTEKELRESEERLAAFMAKHPRFALDAIALQPGIPVTGAAIRATVERAEAARPAPRTYRTRSTAAPPAAAPGPAEPPNPQLARQAAEEKARAEAALAAARADLAGKLGSFTDAHPDVRSARAVVEREQARYGAALSKLEQLAPRVRPAEPAAAAGTERQVVRRSTGRASGAGRAAAAAPRTEADLVAIETDWAKLTRAVTEARQRHNQIEAAFFKVDVLASSNTERRASQMMLIDPAFLPLRPVPPGRTTIAAIFMAVSLLIGVVLAFGRAALDDRICDARDAAELAEVLAEIPNNNQVRRAHAF